MSVSNSPTVATPYITQHCANGNCENSRNLSKKGTLYPACRGEYQFRSGKVVCQHSCHSSFRLLRQMMEQMGHNAPEIPNNRAPVTPVSPVAPVTTGTDREPVVVAPSPSPALPRHDPDTRRTRIIDTSHAFKATPTGRAAPGQLEERVRVAIASRVASGGEQIIAMTGLTPKLISSMVDAENPPSQGAVHAILIRWDKAGLVRLASKPFRFVGFTDLGKRQLVR